ncbi:MAG: hypothetical protein CVT98_02510 [Bacteroidetes bacterium HGW-Bacteroidetes-15]|nr:MAG: hypothetical protein CVT98_02510 [Bacteroidetes bacterium HGW-Bacteroidetes-15]
MSPTNQQTEKKQKTNFLINENTKLLDNIIKQIIDSSSKKLLVISDNRIVYANPKSIKSFGLSIKEIKDKPVTDILISKQGGMQLGHYLAMSASLKRTSNESDLIKVVGKNNIERWFTPTLRRCFWKGKSSILLALNETGSQLEQPEAAYDVNQRDKLALKAANQCIWDLSLNSGMFYICSEFFTMLGYSPQQYDQSLLSWKKILHPDSHKAFEKIINNLKEGKEEPHLWEYQVVNGKNSYEWVLAIWQVVEWDKLGVPARLIGIHMNIDEKKRAELDKEEFQKTLNGFIQNSLDGLVIINEKGIIEEWNPAQEQISLIKRDQAIGKYIWDIQKSLLDEKDVAHQYLNQLKDVFAQIAHTAKNPWEGQIIETKVVLKNYEPKILQQSFFLIKTPHGVKVGTTVKDITESKTTRIKIEKSEERLKLALSAGNVGIWDIDFSTSEQYFSPMTFTILGYRPWEIEPSAEVLEKMIHPEDIEWVQKKVKELKLSGSSLEIEFRIRKKDGNYIWVLSKNRILKNDHNKTIRATGTITDITKQKAVETELRLSEEKLLKNLKQHELISEISYILNTNSPFRQKNKEVLKLLGSFTEASRVYIFEHNYEKRVTTNTYEWCNDGIEPQIKNLQDVPLDSIERWMDGKDYLISSNLRNELPPDFADMMIAQGIKSFILFPLKVSGKLFGSVGFDQCNYERLWSKSETELLKTISNVISFSFERELVQNHYKLNEERYRELTNMLPQIIFEVSLDGKIDFLNQTGFEFFGVNNQMLEKGIYVWNLFPIREVVKMRAMRNKLVNSIILDSILIKAKTADKHVKPLSIYIRPRMEGAEIVNFSGIALQPED